MHIHFFLLSKRELGACQNSKLSCIQDVSFADLLFANVEWQQILLNTFFFLSSLENFAIGKFLR